MEERNEVMNEEIMETQVNPVQVVEKSNPKTGIIGGVIGLIVGFVGGVATHKVLSDRKMKRMAQFMDQEEADNAVFDQM